MLMVVHRHPIDLDTVLIPEMFGAVGAEAQDLDVVPEGLESPGRDDSNRWRFRPNPYLVGIRAIIERCA